MSACQILQVAEHGNLRWRWRHVTAEGAVTESAQSYAFHYECVAAARISGYKPDMKWVPAA